MKLRDAAFFVSGTVVPAIGLLALWQFSASSSRAVDFLFSSPTEIVVRFWALITSGTLLMDAAYTFVPTLAGFVLGVSMGTILGFAILYSGLFARAMQWNMLVLSSIPVFAVAPMTIIWFGVGLKMKIALAVFSTIFVAAAQAYRGGRSVERSSIEFFQLNGATSGMIFRKLTLPEAFDWVFSSLKLNANLALLGVFVGEYMASDHGLGRAMLNAGSVYRVSDMLANGLGMMIFIIVFDRSITAVEARRFAVIQALFVPAQLRRPRSHFPKVGTES